MRGRSIGYSADELAFVEWRQAMSRRALHAAFVERFGRTDVSLVALSALCKRNGWITGRSGRFEKGRAPANKGKPMRAETRQKLARTWFRKGNRPHAYRGPGHEFTCPKDGYVYLIVAERNPHTGGETRRVLKHRYLWEKANGPLPDGHCLKCLDGDKTNTDPANWEAIPRALLPRLSGGRWYRPYDAYEPEVRPAVIAVARLEHAAREMARPAPAGGDDA